MKSQQIEQCKRQLYAVPPNTPTEFMVQFFACLERKGLVTRARTGDDTVDNAGADRVVEAACDDQVVDDQKLKKKRPQSPDLHERLLREIRSKPKLRPIKDGKLVVGTTRPQLHMDSDQDPPSPARKVIKPDLSLLFQHSLEESSGEEDALKSCSLTSSPALDTLSASGTTSPKSPPWHRAADVFVFENKAPEPGTLQRRHTINVCDTARHRKKNVRGPIEYLSLTLQELTHIRSVFTKAELESLAWQPELYQQVFKSKLCFTCRATRFTLFGEWGTKCKICQRTVCSKCIRKMNVPTDHFRNIPVYSLSPSLLTSEIRDLVKKTTRTAPAPSVPQTRASSPTINQEVTDQLQKNHKLRTPDSAQSLLEDNSKDNISQSTHFDSIQSFKQSGHTKGPSVKQSLKGPLMAICCQCREMVTEIVRASRKSLAALSLPNPPRQCSATVVSHQKDTTGRLARN